jgi:hypothetical protein
VSGKIPVCALSLALLALSNAATAGDAWSCTKGDLERTVLIYYPRAPEVLPCEVYYGKPDENVIPRVLWNAQRNAGYCKRKAAEFVERLGSLGWRCSAD